MSRPQHAATGWDDEQDQRDALASLDRLVDDATTVVTPDYPTNVSQVDVPTTVQGIATQRREGNSRAASQPTPRDTVAETPSTLHRSPKARARRSRRQKERVLRREPVPSQPYDYGYVPDETGHFEAQGEYGGNGHGGLLLALLVAIFLLRIAAIALCGLVIVGAIPSLGSRLSIMEASSFASRLLPQQISGILVLQTPFGGAFRGDFVLAAFILYVIDWVLTRIRLYLG